jgi:hypothetical protein
MNKSIVLKLQHHEMKSFTLHSQSFTLSPNGFTHRP